MFKTQTPGLLLKFPSNCCQGKLLITVWFYCCSHPPYCVWLFREKVQLKAWRSSQTLLKCWRKTSGLAIVSTPLNHLNPRLTVLSLSKVCLLVHWLFLYLQVRYVKCKKEAHLTALFVFRIYQAPFNQSIIFFLYSAKSHPMASQNALYNQKPAGPQSKQGSAVASKNLWNKPRAGADFRGPEPIWPKTK